MDTLFIRDVLFTREVLKTPSLGSHVVVKTKEGSNPSPSGSHSLQQPYHGKRKPEQFNFKYFKTDLVVLKSKQKRDVLIFFIRTVF